MAVLPTDSVFRPVEDSLQVAEPARTTLPTVSDHDRSRQVALPVLRPEAEAPYDTVAAQSPEADGIAAATKVRLARSIRR